MISARPTAARSPTAGSGVATSDAGGPGSRHQPGGSTQTGGPGATRKPDRVASQDDQVPPWLSRETARSNAHNSMRGATTGRSGSSNPSASGGWASSVSCGQSTQRSRNAT